MPKPPGATGNIPHAEAGAEQEIPRLGTKATAGLAPVNRNADERSYMPHQSVVACPGDPRR